MQRYVHRIIKIAGTSGAIDKENYRGFFNKLCYKKQQHMPPKKDQGKVACNIKTFSEYDHQRPL